MQHPFPEGFRARFGRQRLWAPGFWSPRGWRGDFAAAARLLTRLPLGTAGGGPAEPPGDPSAGHPARCYPLVGAGIGALAALAYGLAAWLALPPFAAALAALATAILVTGALHEDGLADVADGFGGGRDAARKLAIMRDSRIGTYGVLALALVLAARGGSLAAIAEPAAVAAALVAAHTVSRAGLAGLMWALPPARSDGLGAATGRPGGADALVALAIGTAAAFLLLDFTVAVTALLAAATLQAVLALQARRQIGGATGDVLGAAQQLGEAAVLLVICAGATP
ncbi:MAG: adenosylcobinamide-GDP ribazoletransferase [Kiloniellaceae bacterium]